MEAIILTKEQYNELVNRLDSISQQLNTKISPKKETFIEKKN